MKLLSLIFSFRNEQENLNELITRLNASLRNLSDWNFEYIFVNDDSTDKSEKILSELQKRNPIRIVNLSRRFGITPGILAGFSVSKGDAIIYMDSDLQDPPELIPKLIEKFNNGTDVVHTKRTKRLGESKIKMILTSIAYRLINKSANIDLPIQAGDFKLLSRRAIDHINNLKEFDPYLRGLPVWIGFNQEYVEYIREGRSGGKTKFISILSGNPLDEFIRGITSFSSKPLFFSISFGIISLIFSLILIIYRIYQKNLGIELSENILLLLFFYLFFQV